MNRIARDELPGSRAKARELGIAHYFTRKPCVHGHLSERNTKSGTCLTCSRDGIRAVNIGKRSRGIIPGRSPEEKREYNKAYYAKHSERLKAEQRAWNARNRAHIRQRNREYNETHTESLREKRMAYYAENKQEYLHRNAARRSRQRAATVGDLAQIARTYRHLRSAPRVRCYWCAKPVRVGQRHVDHIIPLSKGGAHAVGNLCASCAPCNLKKNAKMPEDFADQAELRLA